MKNKKFAPLAISIIVFVFLAIALSVYLLVTSDMPGLKTFHTFAWAFLILIMIYVFVAILIYHSRNHLEEKKDQAIIESVSDDYDYLGYVSLKSDKKNDTSQDRLCKPIINDNVPGFLSKNSFAKKLELLEHAFVSEEDREQFHRLTRRETILNELNKDTNYCVNFKSTIKDKPTYYELRFKLLDHVNGKPYFLICSLKNISKEQALHKKTRKDNGIDYIDSNGLIINEETLPDIKDFAESLPSGFYICKADGLQELIYFNDKIIKLFGCANEQDFRIFTNNNLKGMIHPDDYERVTKETEFRIKKDKNITHTECRIMRKDGSIGYIDKCGHFVHSNTFGDIVYAFVNDITETVKLKQSTKDARMLQTERNSLINLAENSLASKNDDGLFAGVRTLLVEDDSLTREVSKEILQDEGAVVTEAVNGQDALKHVLSSPPFELILMDIVMPQMDGIEATKLIRHYETNKDFHSPIIGLTADRHDSRVNDMINAGADACVSKPFDVSEISRVLIYSLRKHSESIEKKLEHSMKVANTDALTYVKNVVAYTDKLLDIQNKINNNETDYGIVICDLNNLKQQNDLYGHDTGDQYIKNGVKLICDIFTHSPVYRIGGDEFAVMLHGEDYKNSDALLKQLIKRIDEASILKDSKSGKVSMACGLALYDSNLDHNFKDTIKRADTEMYKNKRTTKENIK